MSRFPSVVSVLAAAALAVPVLAQDPPAVSATATAKVRTAPGQGFVLEAGDIPVEDLINGAAKFLNRNILFLPQELASAPNVTLQRTVELDARGCEELLSTLLYSRGLVVVPVDAERGFYEVLNLNGQRAREVSMRAVWMTPADVQQRTTLKIPVMTTVELQHIDAPIATNALRGFFSATGGHGGGIMLGNVGNNRAILLQGFPDQVASVLRMLQQIDRPGPTAAPELEQRIERLEALVAGLQKALQAKQEGGR